MPIYEKYFSKLEIDGDFLYPYKSTKKPTVYAILDEILHSPKIKNKARISAFLAIMLHYTLKFLTNAVGQDTQIKDSQIFLKSS